MVSPAPTAQKLERQLERPTEVARLAILLLVSLVAVACGNVSSPSSSQDASPELAATPTDSAPAESPPDDSVAAFAADLEAAGATVTDLGVFNTDPLGGRGVRLCVDGQQVSVYESNTEAERADTAARIDPTDPSNLGTTIIEWAGNPRFWQRDRIVVLYLGGDPAVESRITIIIGQPFARGQGRNPGPDRHAC